MTRFTLAALAAAPLLITACGAKLSGERQAMSSCEAAVERAASVLPEGLVSNVTSIEAGQSGTAVSCAVQSDEAHLMVDATVTCSGDGDDLLDCTAIDAVQTMDGQLLYP